MEALAVGQKGDGVPYSPHFSAVFLPSKALLQIPSLNAYSSYPLPLVNDFSPSQFRESYGEASGLLLALALFTL